MTKLTPTVQFLKVKHHPPQQPAVTAVTAGLAMADTVADKEVGAEAAARRAFCDEVLTGLFVLEVTLAATGAAEHQRGRADAETLVRGHLALGGY